MAGDKDTRSERESHTLVGDLLRRAASPEVLAGVAGAAAAARFTKQAVDHGESESDAGSADEDGPEDEEELRAQPGQEDDADDEDEPRGEAETDDDERADEAESRRREADESMTADETSEDSSDDGGTREVDADHSKLLSRARQYAEQLTGHEVESFSGLAQEDRGWRVGVEVVELSRVPSTTDVLGSYELVLTDEGEFVDFRRAHRYYRNATDDGSA